MPVMNRSFTVVVAALVLAAVLGVAIQRYGRVAVASAGVVEGTGRVEGDRVVVASRAAGQVVAFTIEEGDRLVGNQVVARLEDPGLASRVGQAEQALAAVEARLRSEQAALAVQQQRVPLAIRAAEANVSLTVAVLQQCENLEEARRQEVERLRGVEEPDDETRAQLDEAELEYEQAQQDAVVAQAAVERAESDLQLARLGGDEIVAHIAEVDALTADRDRAAAGVREASVGIKDLEITAPASGTVVSRRARVGEVVAPGTPVVELVDLDALYVVVELAEANRGSVRPGQAARVYAEAAPGGFARAKVTALLAPASGGFEAKVVFDEHPAWLTLGMSARVVIRVREDAPWP
jgi:HlyD family secretion protein